MPPRQNMRTSSYGTMPSDKPVSGLGKVSTFPPLSNCLRNCAWQTLWSALVKAAYRVASLLGRGPGCGMACARD